MRRNNQKRRPAAPAPKPWKTKTADCKYCRGTGFKRTSEGRSRACATCDGTGEHRTRTRRNPRAYRKSLTVRGVDLRDALRRVKGSVDGTIVSMTKVGPAKWRAVVELE